LYPVCLFLSLSLSLSLSPVSVTVLVLVLGVPLRRELYKRKLIRGSTMKNKIRLQLEIDLNGGEIEFERRDNDKTMRTHAVDDRVESSRVESSPDQESIQEIFSL